MTDRGRSVSDQCVRADVLPRVAPTLFDIQQPEAGHPYSDPSTVLGVDTCYDPELGPVDVIDFPDKDRKRWAKVENWGLWLAYPEHGEKQFQQVWMFRLAGRVRFLSQGPRQHGPQHPHLMAATYWAFAHGWRDPAITVAHNLRCTTEVRSGGVEQESMRVSGTAAVQA